MLFRSAMASAACATAKEKYDDSAGNAKNVAKKDAKAAYVKLTKEARVMRTGTTADDTKTAYLPAPARMKMMPALKRLRRVVTTLLARQKTAAWKMHGRCKGQIPSETGAPPSCQAKLSFHLYDPVDRLRKYQIFNFSAAAHGAVSGQR